MRHSRYGRVFRAGRRVKTDTVKEYFNWFNKLSPKQQQQVQSSSLHKIMLVRGLSKYGIGKEAFD